MNSYLTYSNAEFLSNKEEKIKLGKYFYVNGSEYVYILFYDGKKYKLLNMTTIMVVGGFVNYTYPTIQDIEIFFNSKFVYC